MMHRMQEDGTELLEAVTAVARAERREIGAAERSAASEELSEGELDAITDAVLSRLNGLLAHTGGRVVARPSRRRLGWLALAAGVVASVVALTLGRAPRSITPTADRALLVEEPQQEPTPARAGVSSDPHVLTEGGVWQPDLSTFYMSGKTPDAYESFSAEVEGDAERSGAFSLRSVDAVTTETFATLMYMMDAGSFRGHRVRMRGRVESVGTTGHAGLWMRVDGEERALRAFDNMQNRPITGTTEPELHEVVLDVPADAIDVAFGILLSGDGEVWLSELSFDVVPSSTSGMSPVEWWVTGSNPEAYEQGEVREYGLAGSRYLRSTRSLTDDGFGAAMRMTPAEEARGKRMRLSARVRSENVTDWAGLWFRVDGAPGEPSLAFDNMHERGIRGTTGWRDYEVVLDVPETATNLAYGVLISGAGQVWFKNVSLETVDRSVRVTGAEKK